MSDAKKIIHLPHGDLPLPIFLPDATRGVVRAVDSRDLEDCQVEALVMNTFHLMQNPGSSTIQALGKLHHMSAWSGPIVTDSGGFQAYSLIRQNAKYGTLSDKGISFKPDHGRKYQLSPEKTVQLQLSYGADIVICLDDCTHVDDPYETQKISVQRTIAWAKRCKNEFQRILAQKKISDSERPLLFAVIQGGGSLELRRWCATELLEIGFDGFGYGGWPLDAQGKLLTDIFSYVRELIPVAFPLHALGVGHPGNIVACTQLGYDIFDSAMPTRDARHGRLYKLKAETSPTSPGVDGKWFSYLYIKDDKHIKVKKPLSALCDCLCCRHYSLGYLRHLFKINDSLYLRLATMHNLRFMTQLMQHLRHSVDDSHA